MISSQEQRDLVCFQESSGISTAFPSRRAHRNRGKSLEETLLDGVANESAIVDFCSHDRLTGSKVFIAIL